MIEIKITYYTGWNFNPRMSQRRLTEITLPAYVNGMTNDNKGVKITFLDPQFFSYGCGVTQDSTEFALLFNNYHMAYYLDNNDQYETWSMCTPRWELLH